MSFGDASGFGDCGPLDKPATTDRRQRGFGDAAGFGDAGRFDVAPARRRRSDPRR